uniref:GATA zinc finger domain-containing protein 14-like n=1 Tax=Schistosoma mansoni TaxID=6183 RepID=A0A5K4F7R7_SCHMA
MILMKMKMMTMMKMMMILMTSCFYLILQFDHINAQLNEHNNDQENHTISQILHDINVTNPIDDNNNQSEINIVNQLNISLTNKIPIPSMTMTTSNNHKCDLNEKESNKKNECQEKGKKIDNKHEKKTKSQQTQIIIDFSGTNEKKIAIQRQKTEGEDNKKSIIQSQEQYAQTKTERNISTYHIEQQQNVENMEKYDEKKRLKEKKKSKTDENRGKQEVEDTNKIYMNNTTTLPTEKYTQKTSQSTTLQQVPDEGQHAEDQYLNESQTTTNTEHHHDHLHHNRHSNYSHSNTIHTTII